MFSLQDFIAEHQRIFVLTGAGISTGSGIPDYRDEAGDWKQQRPMEYRDFVAQESSRQRYWTRSYIGWQRFGQAEPNPAHRALAQLESRGKLCVTVTQNVDGLHQRAGSRGVIELHGTLATVSCLSCASSMSRAQMQAQLLALNPQLGDLSAPAAPDGDARLENFDSEAVTVPACAVCGGVLKPDVVFFGESVPRLRVDDSFAALDGADAMLVVGSSLMVYSGFRFARRAHQLGVPIVALNRGITRADDLLTHKIEADCVAALKLVTI